MFMAEPTSRYFPLLLVLFLVFQDGTAFAPASVPLHPYPLAYHHGKFIIPSKTRHNNANAGIRSSSCGVWKLPLFDVKLEDGALDGMGLSQQRQQSPHTFDNRLPPSDTTDTVVLPILGRALSKCRLLQEHSTHVMLDETKPALARLFAFLQQSVYSKTSTINNAGRGLFAAQTIPKGTILSLYPVHLLGATAVMGKNEDSAAAVEAVVVVASAEDEEYFEHHSYNTGYRIQLMGDRQFPGNYTCQIDAPYIDTNPTAVTTASNSTARSDDDTVLSGDAWMAHLINDCCACDLLFSSSSDAEVDAVLKYYETVLRGCNSVIVPFGPVPLCAAVATRTVLEGEELFLAYGHAYWRRNATAAATAPAMKDTIRAAQNAAMYEAVVAAMQHVHAKYEQEALELEEIFEMIGQGMEQN